MLIMTDAGAYTAVQDDQEPTRLVVGTYDRESAQTAVDGLEMLCGSECTIREYPGYYMFSVDRVDFAEWVAEEIRQYLTYPIFELAIDDARGEEWTIAHGEIKHALLERTSD